MKLPELQLAPFATQQLHIWAMQKQLGIPDDAHWALVSLTTNASPDDVMAIASSRDCTGVYNAETKFSGGLGGYFAGGEWRLDAIHNRIAAITNVGTEPTDALLTLHYDNGVKKYELQQTIAPGDQMWVNLAQLIRQPVADRSGNFLPVDVTAVTSDLQDLTPGGHSLMANDLAVDGSSGQVVPDCPFCCGIGTEYFSPDPVNVSFGYSMGIGVDGVNPCNDYIYNITLDFTTWSSSNASIAEVTTGKAQGVEVGTATGFAEGTVNGPGQCACNPRIVEVSVPIYVTPAVTFSGTPVVPLGGTAPITATVTPTNNTASITLTLSTIAGTGSAIFAGGQTTMTITNTTVVTIVGVMGSSTPNNIQLSASIPPEGAAGTLATTTITVATANGAIPVNFRQVGVSQLSNGVLQFVYEWDSSTGSSSDLANCSVGEIVNYPNSAWNSPPYSKSDPNFDYSNPFTSSIVATNVLVAPYNHTGFADQHSHPAFLSPYKADNFTATQYYRFQCTYYQNGAWINITGPVGIQRAVSQNSNGTWQYTITKSGSSNSVNPLP